MTDRWWKQGWGWLSDSLRWLYILTLLPQQTRNHFWTSCHVSYWFIIGTAPPVCVFTCIDYSPKYTCSACCHEFWTSLTWVGSRTGMVSLARVITWKTRGFMVNTCRHTKFVHRIRLIHVRKHVNWACWTREFTYRTCEIMGRCWLGSLHLTHLTSPHLTSPHLTSPHLTSPHLTSLHFTSLHTVHNPYVCFLNCFSPSSNHVFHVQILSVNICRPILIQQSACVH